MIQKESGQKLKEAIRDRRNAGSTMVETLVSFVVLFAVLGALYGIVVFSSELYMRSIDISRQQQRFYREIYKKKTAFNVLGPVSRTEYSAGNGVSANGNYNPNHAGLVLELDTTKTDPANYNDSDSLKNSYVSLDSIGVTSYVWTDETVDTTAIAPKAVHFAFDE